MAAAKAGDWDEAVAVFEDVAVKNTIVYSAMLSAADLCKQYSAGLGIFREMTHATVDLDTVAYTCAVVLHARMGQYRPAKKLWDTMRLKRVEVSPPALNAILDAAAVAGEASAAEELLAEARSEGLKVDAKHFSCVVKAYRTTRNAERVVQLLDKMRALKFRPDVACYSTAVGLYNRFVAPQATVSSYVAKIRSRMDADRVLADKYFVDEYVIAVLGGGSFAQVLKQSPWGKKQVSYLVGLPGDSVGAALKAIADARKERMAMTERVEKIEVLLLEVFTAAIQGSWDGRGTIAGTTLVWKNGRQAEIQVRGVNSFSISLLGETYHADFDAKLQGLLWNDGDVWRRASAPPGK